MWRLSKPLDEIIKEGRGGGFGGSGMKTRYSNVFRERYSLFFDFSFFSSSSFLLAKPSRVT